MRFSPIFDPILRFCPDFPLILRSFCPQICGEKSFKTVFDENNENIIEIRNQFTNELIRATKERLLDLMFATTTDDNTFSQLGDAFRMFWSQTRQTTDHSIDELITRIVDNLCHESKATSRCGRMYRSKSQSTHHVLNWRKSNVLTLGLCSLMVITIFALIIAFFPFHNQCISGHSEPPLFAQSGEKASDGAGLLVANMPLKLVATNGEPFPWTDIRLPTFIVPKFYDLYMSPDMNTFHNTGSVAIRLTVTERTNFLVIHIKKLNITEIVVTDMGAIAHNISIEKRLECTQNEQLFIKFKTILLPNRNYSLRINFECQLEEELEGFYVSSYFDGRTGLKKYLLTTHLEPTAARSAFPCFDEPALKGMST